MAAKALPKALQAAASTMVLQDAAVPTPARQAMAQVGQAGSPDALARLNEAMKELKALAAAPLLKRSIDALNREDFVAGGKWALQALDQDERNGVGWYLLGIARERAGDFENSVRAYEAALKLLPEHAEIANDLGRLAQRMGMLTQAEKLFAHFIAHAPERPDGVNNLATVYREQDRRDDAIELLKRSLTLRPDAAMLWNTLGSIMVDDGALEIAFTFFEEACRLDAKFGKARYNLGQAKLGLGDPAGALADCSVAMKLVITGDDREMMTLARSSYQLALGRLGEGWDDYEARLSPQYADVTYFLIDRPLWQPGVDLAGKTFLVVAEQGLGDELLFANVLPDVVERLGPDGKLRLAVEKRLTPLFQRSFPNAEVTAHGTGIHATRPVRAAPFVDQASVDLWAPMGSLMREFRRALDDFPDHKGYLTPDPKRVAHWEEMLKEAPDGPKVGLLWKSATNRDRRTRFFSPFEQWAPVLKTPGISFVNLQYGDCSAELEQAERELGVKIWQPPGIDLKMDLDDVAALCSAMDLTIGFSNATLNIGAACGAPTWLLTTPGVWTRLGSPAYPWYPQVRTFTPPAYGQWGPLMDEVAAALAEYAADR